MEAIHIRNESARIWRLFIGREGEFWSYIDKKLPFDCWPANRSVNPLGYLCIYRRFGGKKKQLLGHRVAKILTDGYEQGKDQIDHLCRNRACCNPRHLEWVTQEENLNRQRHDLRLEGKIGFCRKGHAIAGDNAWFGECRVCATARQIAYYRRNADSIKAQRRSRHAAKKESKR